MKGKTKSVAKKDWIDAFLGKSFQHFVDRTKGITTPIPHFKFNPSTGKMEDVTGKR
jgi:hypothetical protein